MERRRKKGVKQKTPFYTDKGRNCSKCERFKEWSEFNKQKGGVNGHNSQCRECHNSWYKVNKDYSKQFSKKYFQKNKEKYYAKEKERYNSDPLFRLNRVVRQRIWDGLRVLNQGKKSRPTYDAIGCSFEELKEHLEKQFQPGMSWDNWGRYGWHIDHIIPLCSANTKEEFYELCHYTNLQPLWAEDNCKKGGR